jgi:two-component system sensor histidine kinase BaeS
LWREREFEGALSPSRLPAIVAVPTIHVGNPSPIFISSHAAMKFGVTSKLFVAILLANMVIAIVVAVAAQISLKSGFRNYVNEREERRLSTLSDSLANAYRAHGDWQFLRQNETLWRDFNRPGSPRFERDSLRRDSPPDGARPPRGAPPPEGPRNDGEGRGRPPPPPATGAPGPPRPPPAPSTALFDAARHLVVGEPVAADGTPLRAIVVDGVTVGWIASAGSNEPFDRADLRFQEEQLRASWIIGGVAILLAAGVAILLAQGLLAPIKRLATAMHRLARGDYATRVGSRTDDELGKLVADFNHLAVTLEKNEALRRNFMAEISHELRTPLAVLKGELEALEDGIRTPDADSLESLQAEVATLSKLIDDLYDLSLADIGALTYRLEPVDLGEIVGETARAFRERFSTRKISVDVELPAAPLRVDGDPARLTQLCNNLFENSLRYTDADGTLRVAIRRDGDHARVDFLDSAPGVPEALMPRLFERLFRVESSRNRARGGAGLGLALCRSIVLAHGGTITAKASPQGGLWIEIALPALRD